MIATSNTKRLQAAIEKQKQAEKALARRQVVVRDLAAAACLEQDPQHQSLAEQIKGLRKARHRHRLNLSRAKYSCRCQVSRLKKTREKITNMLADEDVITRKLESMENDQRVLQQNAFQSVFMGNEG